MYNNRKLNCALCFAQTAQFLLDRRQVRLEFDGPLAFDLGALMGCLRPFSTG